MSFRTVVAVVLACSGVYAVAYLAIWLAAWDGRPQHLFGDFFVFWTGGRFVLAGHADQIYEWGALHTFQQAYDHDGGDWPVPYPPTFLPVLAAVALLPYLPASLTWIAVTFGAAAAALSQGERAGLRVLALLVSPATLVAVVAGQTGLLSAALAVGGLRLVTTQPVLGGLVLGLLSYKPQLFVLVPIALVAARAWRALLATVVSAAVAAGISVVAYGVEPWLDWLRFLPDFSRRVDAEVTELGPMMVSATAALRGLGVSRGATAVVQVAVASFALVATWRVFRAGPGPLATATLLTAAFLVTPYAYIYDLPLLAAAVILALDTGRGARATVLELTVFFLAWVLPIVALAAGKLHVPLAPAVFVALLVVLRRSGDA